MRHHIIPLLFLLFASVNVSADVLVLVHGYLSGAQTWDENGITQALDSQWQRGGVLVNGPYGVRKLQPAVASDNTYYIVDLPSEAPLMLQASHLEAMLAYVHERHPDEPLESWRTAKIVGFHKRCRRPASRGWRNRERRTYRPWQS